ncbi:MAG: hypothetical protein NTY96_00855 [Bacteroidetes bacterium]|nr:hypothetical protein [Bacteroidota bacterium]
METTIIVSQEVKSYPVWQDAFYAGAGMREQAGINVLGVYQDMNNKNRITVISEAPSPEVAEAFIFNPEIKTIWEKIGVIGETQINILNKVI